MDVLVCIKLGKVCIVHGMGSRIRGARRLHAAWSRYHVLLDVMYAPRCSSLLRVTTSPPLFGVAQVSEEVCMEHVMGARMKGAGRLYATSDRYHVLLDAMYPPRCSELTISPRSFNLAAVRKPAPPTVSRLASPRTKFDTACSQRHQLT